MEILAEKPATKRPAIVRAATRLFARRGIDATSMRDIAGAAGVREAAIYRHFASKEEMSREIFASWYGWYSSRLGEAVGSSGDIREKLRRVARVELSAAQEHSEAFLYFCQNEPRFLRSLPPRVPRAHALFGAMIREAQRRGDIGPADAGVLADMLGGALCAAALSWIRRGRPGSLSRHTEVVAQACWRMIAG